jgi:hypothetical protein
VRDFVCPACGQRFAFENSVCPCCSNGVRFAPAGSTAASPVSAPGGSTRLLELWMPLPWSLTMVNRSMRHRDLYPFALSPRVPEKVTFVHRLVSQVRDEVAAAS